TPARYCLGQQNTAVKKTDSPIHIQPRLMMSSSFSVFRAGISFVMMCIFYTSAVDSPELSPQKFFSTLQPGKATLVYFCQAESPRTSMFLEELNEAAKPLQDYGISVAKVNCVTEETSRYCGSEKDLMKAYLFRGNIALREFPTDTLFDVDAIVAHVLFALLFNEVKYITTLGDLQNIENALKGKGNIAFAYVRAIGTPEHRAVMEAAFVYGTTHQFVLTTEIALLESIGDSLEVDIPEDTNVIVRRAEEEAQMEFLALSHIDLIVFHVESTMYIEEMSKYEDMEDLNIGIQDDEVEETVYRDRKRQLPLELTVELTEETFHATVTASDSIVLFYAGWQAVSMAFLQSYIDVAIKLKGTSTMLLARVNCADWSHVCTKQNVTEFPVVKMYKEGQNPVSYTGMLGTEELLKFIQLNRISCPVNITSVQEAEEYLNGELYKDLISYSSLSVLGLFSPTMTRAKEEFTEAGSYLKGYVTTGIYSEEDVLRLKKTPVGRGVLQAYFGTLPPLPLLVVVNLHSGGHVFAFPSDQAITEQNLLLWLKKLEAGLESHIKVLPAQEWKPPLPAYDFLSMMDAAASEHLTRKDPECIKETDVQESDKEQPDDKSAITEESTETLKMKHSSRSSWFEEAKKLLRHDNKEL
ncbi:hypothetical protein G4228_008645, partial [Cervus hanglu yarkandensis]